MSFFTAVFIPKNLDYKLKGLSVYDVLDLCCFVVPSPSPIYLIMELVGKCIRHIRGTVRQKRWLCLPSLVGRHTLDCATLAFFLSCFFFFGGGLFALYYDSQAPDVFMS